MKARPIENLLKHCEKIDDAYKDWHGIGVGMCGDEGTDYFDMCINKGWVQAVKHIVANYNCTPK